MWVFVCMFEEAIQFVGPLIVFFLCCFITSQSGWLLSNQHQLQVELLCHGTRDLCVSVYVYVWHFVIMVCEQLFRIALVITQLIYGVQSFHDSRPNWIWHCVNEPPTQHLQPHFSVSYSAFACQDHHRIDAPAILTVDWFKRLKLLINNCDWMCR